MASRSGVRDHAELFAELTFMEPGAGLQVPFDDHVAQVIDQRVMQRHAPDRPGAAIGAALQCGDIVHVYAHPLCRAECLNRFFTHCNHEVRPFRRQQKMLHTEYKRLDAEF